jgi:methyltransferase
VPAAFFMFAERLILPVVVFAAMLVEAHRASTNERHQRARGGVEPINDVYSLMRIAYPGAFAAMFLEGALRARPATPLVLTGAIVFLVAKSLKWWAILSLGPFWTFRVIVVPGAGLVRVGPYRWLRHPNYVGVMGELAGVALMTAAWWSGAVGLTLFGWLVARRVSVEDRALNGTTR